MHRRSGWHNYRWNDSLSIQTRYFESVCPETFIMSHLLCHIFVARMHALSFSKVLIWIAFFWHFTVLIFELQQNIIILNIAWKKSFAMLIKHSCFILCKKNITVVYYSTALYYFLWPLNACKTALTCN